MLLYYNKYCDFRIPGEIAKYANGIIVSRYIFQILFTTATFSFSFSSLVSFVFLFSSLVPFAFYLCLSVFFKQKIYILMHIQRYGRVSDKKSFTRSIYRYNTTSLLPKNSCETKKIF